MTRPRQGFCPTCSTEDSISLVMDTPLIRVQIREGLDSNPDAIPLLDNSGAVETSALPPEGRFYCDNCSTFFHTPVYG